MKIRSVTYFDNPGEAIEEGFQDRCQTFMQEIQHGAADLEYEIQTIRFASPPFPTFLRGLSGHQQIDYAIRLERLLEPLGFAYVSLGPALPAYPDSYPLAVDIIRSTDATFCSAVIASPAEGVSLEAVRACGGIIRDLAPLDPNGFANLYFAALGNVPPGGPFFPAAYHSGGKPAFAIAVEGADLAVEAFRDSSNFQDARQALIHEIEQAGKKITSLARGLEKAAGAAYQGIDYSLAPFPDPDLSIGTALEELGVHRLGQHGSLAAAAFLMDCIDRADFPRVGFSGLMLPVLEDALLSQRAAEGTLSVMDLLLYSTVCGTGLDTVPLPGDSSAEEISAVLMDLAFLSLRLNKPLTARLMPIPGKKAGDPTNFDFPFFANSKVLALESSGLGGSFLGDGLIEITDRPES